MNIDNFIDLVVEGVGANYLLEAVINAGDKEALKKVKKNDWVIVYHGTRKSEIMNFINGFDSTKIHYRHYGGPRHQGVFVAPTEEEGNRWSSYGECVLEIIVRAANLHDTDYSGNINRKNPVSKETLQYYKDKYPESFRPLMVNGLLTGGEPQALLIGLVKPSQILRVRYKDSIKGESVWYTREEFMRLGVTIDLGGYGKTKIDVKDSGVDLASTKITVEEMITAIANINGMPYEKVEKTVKRYVQLKDEERLRELFYSLASNDIVFGEKAIDALIKKLNAKYNN